MTSATTLIVMIPLAAMGGSSIREFVLPLMVGVIAGAYSSISICSPLYYEFNRPGQLSKYEKQVEANIKKAKKDKKASGDGELAAPANQVDAPAVEAAVETAQSSDQSVNKDIKSDTKKTDVKRSKRYVKGNKK